MIENSRLLVIVGAALILRWCVAHHPYSGRGKSPMYGDYEAQRHWQEITLNVPMERWYSNSSDNDLLYWGLDYPPLTAYHSLIIAKVARFLNPAYVELRRSRGFESEAHKYFMRLTVILADAVSYLPAMVFFVRGIEFRDSKGRHGNVFGFKKRDFVLIAALLYPGIVLVDHAHFQYNCVSLGLFVAATAAILRDFTVVASFFFVLALNYKQMELYHALPFFFYILGRNTPSGRKNFVVCVRDLILVATTVITTFVVIWAPFAGDRDCLFDVVSRLFPLGRGVFEDKVANFWCALNVVWKLRNIFDNYELARICLIVTTLAIFPSCLDLYRRPAKEKFVVSLINSSLGFYLFSFQVHEKSILLAAVPVVLHLHEDPLPCFWFLIVSTFSMLPLFIKDELFLAYSSVVAIYFLSFCLMWNREFEIFSIPKNKTPKTLEYPSNFQRKIKRNRSNESKFPFVQYFPTFENLDVRRFLKLSVFWTSMIGCAVLSVVSLVVEPPKKYPDLFALLVSVYSCLHFCIFFVYFNYRQIYVSHSAKAKTC